MLIGLDYCYYDNPIGLDFFLILQIFQVQVFPIV